jgi:hypothetical protein
MMLGWFKRKFGPPDMGALSSAELMALWDRYWNSPVADYAEFVRACNELAGRGPEIRDWCRRLLTHPDYAARETGAFLLGQLGRRGQLGDAVEAVVDELGALTRRPIEEDCKELQAVDAAINALGEIGRPSAVPHLRALILSEDEFLAGDCQWDAAEVLGRLVGQPFGDAPDQVQAAREWLTANPSG